MVRHDGVSCIVFTVLLLCIIYITSWTKSGPTYEAANDIRIEYSPQHGSFPRMPVTMIEAFVLWQKCVTGLLNPLLSDVDMLWSSFDHVIDHCYATTPVRNIKMTGVTNNDEFKFHIFNNTDKTPSTVITLGVGLDVIAEKKLKLLLPEGSKFYGADPIYEDNDRIYSAVGQFFPIAVGKETMLDKAYVMPRELKGSYEYRTVVHIDIITFLSKLVRTHFIDQLLMDNEGAEYEILPMMGPHGEFDANQIVVCQINVEMHYGHENFKERFAYAVGKLLKDSRYVILRKYKHFDPGLIHHRLFLLNFQNEKCVEKYILQYFENF